MLPAIRLLQVGQRQVNNRVSRPLTSSTFPLLLGVTDSVDLSAEEIQFIEAQGLSVDDVPALVRQQQENPYSIKRGENRRRKAKQRRKQQLVELKKMRDAAKKRRAALQSEEEKEERNRRKKVTMAVEAANSANIHQLSSATRKAKVDKKLGDCAKEKKRRDFQRKMLLVYESSSFSGMAREEEAKRVAELERIALEKLKRQKQRQEKMDLEAEVLDAKRAALDRKMRSDHTKVRKDSKGGLTQGEIDEELEAERQRKSRKMAKRRQLLRRREKFTADKQKMLAHFYEKQYTIKNHNGKEDSRFYEQTASAGFNAMFKAERGSEDANLSYYRAANVLVRAVGHFQRIFRKRQRAKLYKHKQTTSVADSTAQYMHRAQEMAARKAEARRHELRDHTVDHYGVLSYDAQKVFAEDPMGYVIFAGTLHAQEAKDGVPWAGLNEDEQQLAKNRDATRRLKKRDHRRR
jgi:hypothetical protein